MSQSPPTQNNKHTWRMSKERPQIRPFPNTQYYRHAFRLMAWAFVPSYCTDYRGDIRPKHSSEHPAPANSSSRIRPVLRPLHNSRYNHPSTSRLSFLSLAFFGLHLISLSSQALGQVPEVRPTAATGTRAGSTLKRLRRGHATHHAPSPPWPKHVLHIHLEPPCSDTSRSRIGSGASLPRMPIFLMGPYTQHRHACRC